MSKQVHTNKAIALRKEKRSRVSSKAQRAIDEGDVQSVIDSLTHLQRRFVEEMVLDPRSGSEAVLRAGYKTNNARQIAFQLLENPAIRISIDALRAERGKNTDVTKDFVLRKIIKTIESAEEKGNHNAVLRGAELLAKHLGMFIDRTEISGPDGEAIRLQKTEEDAADFTKSIIQMADRKKEK